MLEKVTTETVVRNRDISVVQSVHKHFSDNIGYKTLQASVVYSPCTCLFWSRISITKMAKEMRRDSSSSTTAIASTGHNMTSTGLRCGVKRTAKRKGGPPAKKRCEDKDFLQLQKDIERVMYNERQRKRIRKHCKIKSDTVLSRTYPQATVYNDYSCVLNQTDIVTNTNKFFTMQLLKNEGTYVVFTRSGRVGREGQHKSYAMDSKTKAFRLFRELFQKKTDNEWENRKEFKSLPGRHAMIDIVEKYEIEGILSRSGAFNDCSLFRRLQYMLKLIVSHDAVRCEHTGLYLDPNRMPLGKLSEYQIAIGLQILVKIEEAIGKSKSKKVLVDLSSQFYTMIPHNFGNRRPKIINSKEIFEEKMKAMLNLSFLVGISTSPLHPLTQQYFLLKCSLWNLHREHPEFQLIQEYAAACPSVQKQTFLDIWKVDRDGEQERFSAHDDIENRKLLWHGTKVQAVSSILKNGLQIMTNTTRGSLGRGIYFASEYAKGSYYVHTHAGIFEREENVGFMFLVEVALGKEWKAIKRNRELTEAPKGYDSIFAQGRFEPDPQENKTIDLDEKKVVVPVGKWVKRVEWQHSEYTNSEYVVYKESQTRIRYLVKLSYS